MKNLKHFAYLFLAILFMTSCERETDLNLENSKIDTQENKSITTLISEGVNLNEYFESLQKIKNFESRTTIQQPDDMAVIYFYYDGDDFDCNLTKEDFEEFKFINDGMPSLLDEFTDSRIFSPGDILSGISFETIDHLGYEEYHDTSNGLFICNWYSMPNVLMSNYWNTDLVIRFKNNNVTEVSMNLYNLLSTDVHVSVYGIDDIYLGMTTVYNQQYFARYLAMSALQPIKKIVISSDYYGGYEGVDFIGFGNCNDPDYDNDGVLNEDDPYPNSNMSEVINIGGCEPGIDNIFTKKGTTMMDEIDALKAEINAQYNGDNYAYLHKRFMTKLAGITYYWVRARLITTKERTAISSCAWGANIPYYSHPI